jgi:uncharacterized LabA/DUF88 family protein
MAETLKGPTKPTQKGLLGTNPQDRVHVFIDAQQLIGMQRVINKKIDLKKFMSFFKTETRLIRASYFVLMREDLSEGARNVIDMCEYAGFDVVRKWGSEFQEANGQYRFRGSVVPEMTVAIIDAAEAGAEHIVLLSGDGDMFAAVEAAKQREARVTVLGIENTVSDDLRRACDAFVEFSALEPAGVFNYDR